MAVLRSGLAMAAGAAWLLTGSESMGRKLIDTLTGGEEDARTLAGMVLVKGGDKGRRLVVDALQGGAESPELIAVLQSIGGPEVEAVLADLARHEDRPIAEWAKRALSELTEIRRRRGQEA